MAHHAKIRRQRMMPISGAIERLLSARGWKERVNRERLLILWDQIVGEVNAAHAKARRVEGQVLVVEIDSPVWAHTLSMMKMSLLERLRAAVPDLPLKDIRFVGGDDGRSDPRMRRYRKASRPSS